MTQAWRLVANREPSVEERRVSEAAIGAVPLREFALAMYNLNAFLYVE